MASPPDWRSAHAAESLSRLNRAGFAAEFLRRNPNYRRDYRRMMNRLTGGMVSQAAAQLELARRWGLSFPFRSASGSDGAAAGPVAPGTDPNSGGSRGRSR